MDNSGLEAVVSRTVAELLDSDEAGKIASALAGILPPDISEEDKRELLEKARLDAIEANKPGYGPLDGKIGYLLPDINLKEAVLKELSVMAEADFDEGEHAAAWKQLMAEISGTPEAEFTPGFSVICPDDLVLNISSATVREILEKLGVQV